MLRLETIWEFRAARGGFGAGGLGVGAGAAGLGGVDCGVDLGAGGGGGGADFGIGVLVDAVFETGLRDSGAVEVVGFGDADADFGEGGEAFVESSRMAVKILEVRIADEGRGIEDMASTCVGGGSSTTGDGVGEVSGIGDVALAGATSGSGSSTGSVFGFRVLGLGTLVAASVLEVIVLVAVLRGIFTTGAASMPPDTVSGRGFFRGRPLFFEMTSPVDIIVAGRED